MKRLIISIFTLLGLSAVAALVTWGVVGSPDRSVSCLEEELEEHQVCLETVREWDAKTVLWVDARKRDKWQEDGVEGSVLVNEEDDWNEMESEFATAVFGDGEVKQRVVVYCNKAGCKSSSEVSKRLREGMAEQFGFEVFVLHGGIKALKQENQ